MCSQQSPAVVLRPRQCSPIVLLSEDQPAHTREVQSLKRWLVLTEHAARLCIACSDEPALGARKHARRIELDCRLDCRLNGRVLLSLVRRSSETLVLATDGLKSIVFDDVADAIKFAHWDIGSYCEFARVAALKVQIGAGYGDVSRGGP